MGCLRDLGASGIGVILRNRFRRDVPQRSFGVAGLTNLDLRASASDDVVISAGIVLFAELLRGRFGVVCMDIHPFVIAGTE
jgi:hypothetical protein